MKQWFADLVSGIGSIFNLAGRSREPRFYTSDEAAIAADWAAVADDMRAVMPHGARRSGRGS